MTLAAAMLLLQSALSLLVLVQSNPLVPPTVRANAIQVAQTAITSVKSTLASQSSQKLAPGLTASSEMNAPSLPANALNDLYAHFWTGTHESGRVIPTWDGIVGHPLYDSRGGIWHAGTFLDVLYTQYQINPTDSNAQPIRAEWNYIKSVFSDSDLTTCGQQSPQNFASDDTGWNAATFLQIYDVTRDARALNAAKGAVECGFARWSDSQLGGGLWYSDDRNVKSLYGTGLADDAFRLYQITNDKKYLTLAQQSYDWMQQYLLRSDNLYWTDYGWWTKDHSSVPAPLGIERPNDIRLANSVSYLAGNMGMDILHARLYRLTGDEMYKQRAAQTAAAILATYKDTNGGFLDDRDAWTNAHFMREWIIEVYPLLSSDLQNKALDMFNTTANAVVAADRTSDGYYGAAWNGPLSSAWDKINVVPEHIMTSATAIEYTLGPSLIAAHVPPTKMESQPPLAITGVLLGQTGEDVAGMLVEKSDGIKDVHIRLSGVPSALAWMRVTTPDAGWEAPGNGTDWIVAIRPTSDPSVVDAYFDYYKPYASYTVNLKVADGGGQTVSLKASTPHVTGVVLGGSGQDVVGTSKQEADGIQDVHIRLSNVAMPLSGVRITTIDAGWESPANGVDWLAAVRPQNDPTVVDVYFDYYKQYDSYTAQLTFINGQSSVITVK